MKLCTKCGSGGPFGKSKRASDGLTCQCKRCISDEKSVYYQENKEKLAAGNAAWRRENAEKIKINRRKWRAANKGKLSECKRKWRLKNPQKHKETQARYTRKHPEKCKEYQVKNRDRRNAQMREKYANGDRERRVAHMENRRAKLSGGKVTTKAWREVLARFDGRCAYCFAETDRPTMDHIVPLSRGGKHEASNVAPACGPCNSSKNAKPLVQWLDLGRDFKVIAKAA